MSSAAAAVPTGPIKIVNAAVRLSSPALESAAKASDVEDDKLEPITMTITLLEGPSGGYVNQAALETFVPVSSSSATVPNPKSRLTVDAAKPTSTDLAAASKATVVRVRRMVKLHASKPRRM